MVDLRWLGHVEGMERLSWVKKLCMNAIGRVSRGRPKLTCNAILQNNLRVEGLSRNTALDHITWRNDTRWIGLTHTDMYWDFHIRWMDGLHVPLVRKRHYGIFCVPTAPLMEHIADTVFHDQAVKERMSFFLNLKNLNLLLHLPLW